MFTYVLLLLRFVRQLYKVRGSKLPKESHYVDMKGYYGIAAVLRLYRAK